MSVHYALWDSHVVERRSCPETGLRSPGQPVPGVSGQVAFNGTSVHRLFVLILQSVQSHEGQLLEKKRRFPVSSDQFVFSTFDHTEFFFYISFSSSSMQRPLPGIKVYHLYKTTKTSYCRVSLKVLFNEIIQKTVVFSSC